MRTKPNQHTMPDAISSQCHPLRAVALVLLSLIFFSFGSPAAEPELMTEHSDYQVGSTALIIGSGFEAGETVTLQMWHGDGTPAAGTNDPSWQVLADIAGEFALSWAVCQEDCPGETLELYATGDDSGLIAQTIFSIHHMSDPYVLTDKPEYLPGSNAHISGGGFQADEIVQVEVLHADGTPLSGTNQASWAVVADSIGGFQTSWAVCDDEECLGALLKVSVEGQTSGRSSEIIFADSLSDSAGSVDLSFDAGSVGLDNEVRSVVVQPDGKVLVGGLFRTVNGEIRGGVARFNGSGSLDHTFLNGLPGAWTTEFAADVYSVAVQSDGKVLIAGNFTAVNGVARTKVARLHTDGSLDTTFMDGLGGPNGSVQSIAVQSDGRVLIAGSFSSVHGVSRGRVARLNSDGSLDTTFVDGLAGADRSIFSVAIQADGKVLIGGEFRNVNGVARNYIARLNSDGSFDTSFMDGQAGPSYTVNSVAVQPDGKVLIGGIFWNVNGVYRGRVARLTSDGGLDTSFMNGQWGANTTVRTVALQTDGKVLIGGDFTAVNGMLRYRLARLNADGTIDATFLNGLAGANRVVRAIAAQPDGKVWVGGGYSSLNGVARHRLARLNADGSLDSNVLDGPAGPDNTVYSVAMQPDGKMVIGGEFFSVDGATRSRVARLNGDGSLDTSFLNGQTGASLSVYSVAMQPDGKVLIGGAFTYLNGSPRNRIARLNADGSLDTTFLNGLSGADGQVRSIAVQSDGKLVIGGYFWSINGVARRNIARLNADGSLDTTFQDGMSGANSLIFSVAVQADGKVVIAGDFTTVNGVSRNRIARLDATGSLDTTFLNGMSGASMRVDCVTVQADGKVLLGGRFTTVNGWPRNRIARLHSDGSLDATFQAGMSGANLYSVNSLAVQTDGKVLIGGDFTLVNGATRGGIARLHTDGSLDTTFQEGMSGGNFAVYCVVVQPDDDVVIGGDFTAVNSLPADRVARLHGSDAD